MKSEKPGAEGVEIEIKKRSAQREAEAAENLERWKKSMPPMKPPKRSL